MDATNTNRQIASEIATDCVNAIGAIALSAMREEVPEEFDLCGKIERALNAKELEADKNGYERGRKDSLTWIAGFESAQTDDETLLRECADVIRQFKAAADCHEAVHPPWNVYKDSVVVLEKLSSRLAPSVGLSEGKEKS